MCLLQGEGCHAGKSDVKSAFRNLPICKKDWCLLVMKATNPVDLKTYYFVDKCLPFGASISCALFQEVSDAIAHIYRYKTGSDVVNYLDDYFFVALLKKMCDDLIDQFLSICREIGMPISMDKTFGGCTQIVFLGLLIDTIRQMIFIPQEKVNAAERLIKETFAAKKITIKKLQKLCGTLNFFARCIIPARAFTRRLYAKTAGNNLKAHHHVRGGRGNEVGSRNVAEIFTFTDVFFQAFHTFHIRSGYRHRYCLLIVHVMLCWAAVVYARSPGFSSNGTQISSQNFSPALLT